MSGPSTRLPGLSPLTPHLPHLGLSHTRGTFMIHVDTSFIGILDPVGIEGVVTDSDGNWITALVKKTFMLMILLQHKYWD